MKAIESGKDRVEKICEVLRKEAIEPAKREAEEIVEGARLEAKKVLKEAASERERLLEEARQEIQRQKTIFQSNINQACKQALQALRQSIEEKLFHQGLMQLLTKHTQEPKVLAQIVTAVVKGLEKEGIEANLSVYIPAAVPARSVNLLLAHDIVEKLKEKSVLVGPLTGGIEVKLHQENVTVDISDAALKEIVASYIRKDFREIIFAS